MQRLFYILLIVLFGIADSHAQPPVSKSKKNYKDKNGQKQGTWDFKENGYTKGFVTYKNDTLNGVFRHWINYPQQIIEGQYVMGVKEGFWKHYENDTMVAMVVKYHRDSTLWMGFPLANYTYHTPMKEFGIYSDSLFVECPYANDTIWYRGLFIHKKPVGIHTMYYLDGKIKFEHDYSTSTVKIFNENGALTEEKKVTGKQE